MIKPIENDGTLPLPAGTQVNLLGEYYNYRVSAIGAGLIKPRWLLNIKQAFAQSGSMIVSENATLQHNVKQIIKVLVRCI